MGNPFGRPSQEEVTTLVREAVAENVTADERLEGPTPDVQESEDEMLESSPEDSVGDTEERITGYAKLSKLIEEDFPFDESQMDAIDGISTEQYACLTGAAGTGKTTTTKAIVDKLLDSASIASVDMKTYWKKGYDKEDDGYERPESWIPAVAMCAFTGRATQMIKKNFPRDWHGNIMTIHRMLGFYPETYEDWDDDSGEYRNKMRFVPSYTAEFKLPWDIIIIDEAGMLGIDLWEQLWAACKDGCRIIMIGDINQLPPVHGRSVFGFAMLNWPSWELTHVHRQQGVNNPIVDNAWRILMGRMPESEGRFQMVELKGDAAEANRRVRKMLGVMREREIYDPIRDSVITPINGEEGSRGFQLGQLPLNRDLALQFNPQSEHPRFIIDGGRERKQFAVGDKVMATKNDWDTGITNGMTGVIVDIAENGEYSGDRRIFGTVEEVQRYIMEDDESDNDAAFTLDDLENSMDMLDEGDKKKKESRERGPSSHIVTVRFGDADHGIEVPFQSLSEVGSLMTAYVVTCHKMQGGESPVVIIICHAAHRAMLYREWLYTAVTRASEKCILLYSTDALRAALNKQKMQGSSLRQKVLAFNALQEAGSLAKQPTLPESDSTRNRLLDLPEVIDHTQSARLASKAVREGGLAQLIAKKRATPVAETETVLKVKVQVVGVETRIKEPKPRPEPEVVDGGDLKAKSQYDKTTQDFLEKYNRLPTPSEYTQLTIKALGLKNPLVEADAEYPALPAPPKLVSQYGAVKAMLEMSLVAEQSKFLLPAPTPEKPKNPFARRV